MTRETYFIERFEESRATFIRFVEVLSPLFHLEPWILLLRRLFSASPFRLFFDRSLDPVSRAFDKLFKHLLFRFAMVCSFTARQQGAIPASGLTVLGVMAIWIMAKIVGSDPYRHRMTTLGLLFLLAAGGLRREASQRRRPIFVFCCPGAFLLTGLWMVL